MLIIALKKLIVLFVNCVYNLFITVVIKLSINISYKHTRETRFATLLLCKHVFSL